MMPSLQIIQIQDFRQSIRIFTDRVMTVLKLRLMFLMEKRFQELFIQSFSQNSDSPVAVFQKNVLKMFTKIKWVKF